jgi:hypothetical protein
VDHGHGQTSKFLKKSFLGKTFKLKIPPLRTGHSVYNREVGAIVSKVASSAFTSDHTDQDDIRLHPSLETERDLDMNAGK